jgi:hypothetical protein
MSTTLVTYYTPAFNAMAELTLPRMSNYADRHGMAFQAHRIDDIDGESVNNRVWMKTMALMLHDPEPTIWMDVDCLILDDTFDFSTRAPLRTARDGDGLCACILSVGNTLGWNLISTLWSLKDVRGGYKQDQSTLRHLIEYFPLVADKVTSDIIVSDPVADRAGAPVYHAWTSARGYDQAVETVLKLTKV